MAEVLIRDGAGPLEDSASSLGRQRAAAREFLVDAYYVVAVALICGVSYHPAVVAVMLLGFGLLVTSLRARGVRAYSLHFRKIALFALPMLALVREPIDEPHPLYVLGYQGVCVLAAVCGVLYYSRTQQQKRWILYLIGGLKLALLIGGLLLVRRPMIDVWQLQQHAVDFVLQGKNPYTTPIGDIYRGGYSFGHQAFYSYAPLNLLLSIPAKALFGDYRYGLLGSLLASLLLFRQTGKLLGVSVQQIDFLSLLVLLHPRLERLIIYGWFEPYLILLLSLAMYLYASGRKGIVPTALIFALPLLKQYVAAPLLLYLLIVRPSFRSLAWSLLLSLLAVSPLLVWNFEATIRNGLLFFVKSIGFRTDSISLSVAIFQLTGYPLGVKTSLAVQVSVGLLASWLLRKDLPKLARFVMASAAALFASFLFAPQAFLNYYFFVSVMLVWAALLVSPSQQAARQDAPADAPEDVIERPLGPALRALWVVLATAAIALFASSLYYHFLCPRRASVGEQRLVQGLPLLDDGQLLAREEEQLFVCRMRHCFGPLCHEELSCVCAEKETFQTPHILAKGLEQLGRSGALCELDSPQPRPADRHGKCQRARCHLRVSKDGIE